MRPEKSLPVSQGYLSKACPLKIKEKICISYHLENKNFT
jgi:hypothetical protein